MKQCSRQIRTTYVKALFVVKKGKTLIYLLVLFTCMVSAANSIVIIVRTLLRLSVPVRKIELQSK